MRAIREKLCKFLKSELILPMQFKYRAQVYISILIFETIVLFCSFAIIKILYYIIYTHKNE